MKKIAYFTMLSILTALPVFAANWQYDDHTIIDMDSAKIKQYENTQELQFKATHTYDNSIMENTYVYNPEKRTIQIKEMRRMTGKIKYKSTFSPESIDSSNPVIQERTKMAISVYNKLMEKKKK